MLARGDFNLVAVGRALLSDPAWAAKVRDGHFAGGGRPRVLKHLVRHAAGPFTTRKLVLRRFRKQAHPMSHERDSGSANVAGPSITPREILASWGRILTGNVPMLSIEITRECPLTCPGCYAYGDTHLGGAHARETE